jgi:glycosyltransferase involved in cell wall biosynthesis
VHQEARRLGIESHVFNSSLDLLKQLPRFLKGSSHIAVCATGVSHSLIFLLLNLRYRLKNVHLHLVHGGTEERLSYGRKKVLNYLPITFVAVSAYVQQRLIANGVRAKQIKVLENFLPDEQIHNALQRPAFTSDGVHKVVIVSRVDPIKRLDVLLDALDLEPALHSLNFRILGTGWDLHTLSERAKQHPNVSFIGFSEQVAQELANADLLLHCCPVEPFGLAVLEAMAAKLPLLLPDAGGAGGLIPPLDLDNPHSAGLHFQANNPHDLAGQLLRLHAANAQQLNTMAANGYQRLSQHYSSHARLQDYRAQFAEVIV